MNLEPVLEAAESLPVPSDYLTGFDTEHLIIPREILAFSRTTPEDLYQPALENRSHHRFVLMIPLQGSGMVSLDNAVFQISPGKGMLFFPWQFHYYMDVSPTEITWLFITFQGVDPARLAPLKDHLFTFDEPELDRLHPFIKNYRSAGRSGSPNLHFSLGSFLHYLIQNSETLSISTPIDGSDPLIGKINSCVSMTSGEGAGIASIAKKVGVSASHLRKIFRESYGVSIGSYLHNLQMHRAATWLATSDLPIGEIADRCGYRSQAAFSRSFRQDHGETPRQYRLLRGESRRSTGPPP